mmetsp:Transcript_94821/g.187830  ORF Transcript_94821/g.187830 Transcript_94821/m.187830 type:complete len:200 (-) Transcript_94821:498-1097(-)
MQQHGDENHPASFLLPANEIPVDSRLSASFAAFLTLGWRSLTMAPNVASTFASWSSSRRLRASTAVFLTCQTRSVKHFCKLATVSESPVGAHRPSTSAAVLRTSGCLSSKFAAIARRMSASIIVSMSVSGCSTFRLGACCCVTPLFINMVLLRRSSGMRSRRAKSPKASTAVRLISGFQSARQAFNGFRACCLSPFSVR